MILNVIHRNMVLTVTGVELVVHPDAFTVTLVLHSYGTREPIYLKDCYNSRHIYSELMQGLRDMSNPYMALIKKDNEWVIEKP